MQRTETAGIGQGGGYQGTVATRKLGGTATKVVLSHGRRAVEVVAHLNAVQVHLHDALLAPNVLNEKGEIGLETLAHPGGRRPEKHVLGRLLTDGAATAKALAHEALGSRFLDALNVEAIVLQEKLVLARHHGQRQVLRHLGDWYPRVMKARGLAFAHVLHHADEHQRRVVNGQPAVGHHGEDAADEEEQQYVADDF